MARTWKQAFAFALSFEMIFAPSLANARRFEPIEIVTTRDLKESDRFLKEQEKIAEMLGRGALPEFGPDDRDPWGVQGQYVVILNRQGHVIDRYFLDESTLERDVPAYSKFRPVLVKNPENPTQQCLAIEATSGEDAKGEHGFVVARLHLPRFCDVATFTYDDEVLTVVDNQGRISVANYNYVTDQLFRGKIFFVKNVYVPPKPIDLSQSQVTATVLTIGAVPVDPSELTDDTLVAFDNSNNPLWVAGDTVVRVDGKFKWNLSHQTSRNAILFEMIKIYVLAAYRNGSPAQIENARALIAEAEKHVDDFSKRIAAIDQDSANPAIAVLVEQMGQKDIAELEQQIVAFKTYATRENDSFNTEQWFKGWKDVVAGAKILNAGAVRKPIVDVEEDHRVNWQTYYPKRNQTSEQAVASLNAGADRAVYKNPKFYAKIAFALAGTLAFLNFPEVYESSPVLKDIGMMAFLYNQWPNVLKDAAYRQPLKSMTFWAIASTWVPDALSIGAKWSFQILEKATFGRSTPLAQKIRDMANFWIDQGRWQRLVTFGYRLGGALMVSPLIRAVEDVGQQKALLSAARAGQKPWRVISPEDALGQTLKLDRPQTVGLTTPSIEGAKRKLKRMIPGVNDPGAEIWERKRLKSKRQLQEITQYEKDRKKQYARMLAGLVVAEQEGMPYELLLKRVKDRDFRVEDLYTYIKTPEGAVDLELNREEIYQQIKDFAFEFKTDPIIRVIDAEQLAKDVEEFRAASKEIKALKSFARARKELVLESKRNALYVWDNALNQGREEAKQLNSMVSGEEVWRNTEQFFPIDNVMVGVMPAFVNFPMLQTRADLLDPTQLAAQQGAWFSMRPVHVQDITTNINFHFFLGAAMDGLVYDTVMKKSSKILTPREQVAETVLIKDGNGKEKLVLPQTSKKAKPYVGLYDEQSLLSAASDYGSIVYENIFKKGDLGLQASNYLRSSFSTLWIFMSLQFASRMWLGHQGLSATLIGSEFLFAASPIFYKWWGWIIQPANNQYHANKELQKVAFQKAFGWLTKAEGLKTEDPSRAGLQTLAVKSVHARYQKNGIVVQKVNGKKVKAKIDPRYAPDAEETDLEQKAEYWLNLARTAPPRGLLANQTLTKITSQIRAVGSTVTAIPMLVMATNALHQTVAFAAKWTGYSALTQAFMILFLGPKSRGRDAVKGGYREIKKRVFGCETALSS